MRAIQWATLKVSPSWVREMTPMPIIFGGIIAACVRMTNGNKWRRANVKKCIRVDHSGILIVNEVYIGESSSKIKEVEKMVEGLSRQIASLTAAKSTEPHDHDSYPDHGNAIGVTRDHLGFSWSQGF